MNQERYTKKIELQPVSIHEANELIGSTWDTLNETQVEALVGIIWSLAEGYAQSLTQPCDDLTLRSAAATLIQDAVSRNPPGLWSSPTQDIEQEFCQPLSTSCQLTKD